MSGKTEQRPKPVVLVILDGWGHSSAPAYNAIAAAKTPVWDSLTRDYPHGLINASELHVGLPAGQMGNSEVGHMNIGSGRVLMQELPRIDAAIADSSLADNEALLDFVGRIKLGSGHCHLMGLASPGGVHAHQNHMLALAILLTRYGIKVHIHAFLDGRDTPPKSALDYIRTFEAGIGKMLGVSMATVSGRYFAMDRDKRWDRVQKAYDAIVSGEGEPFGNAEHAIRKSYNEGVTDEFILPCAIGGYRGMQDGDGVLMANFRSDRVREILTSILDPGFKEFPRSKTVRVSAALGMTEYSSELKRFMPSLFPPQPMTQVFGEIVSKAGMKQLRIAETEKYAHVTFFFNGGREKEFPGEERILVPSPKVATYDLKPEMSAPEVTDKLVDAIGSGRFDVIVANYANTDMVGHTGNIAAAAKAVEAVDQCLGRLAEAVSKAGGVMVITADHGNAEQMFDDNTKQPHTAHTLSLVPLLIIGERFKGKKIALPEGKLSDVAPTLLQLLGLPQPAEMTGRSLLAGMRDEQMSDER